MSSIDNIGYGNRNRRGGVVSRVVGSGGGYSFSTEPIVSGEAVGVFIDIKALAMVVVGFPAFATAGE